MFGFSEKNKDETTETKKSSPWGDAISGAVADARKAGMGAKARAKSGRETNEGASDRERLSRAGEDKLRKVFEPEAWKAIVKIPFTLGRTITGRECWDASKEQVDTLAVTTGATAEYFLSVEPKWAVAFMCATNWLVILSEKFVMNAKERVKEEAMNPPHEVPKTQTTTSINHPLMTVK